MKLFLTVLIITLSAASALYAGEEEEVAVSDATLKVAARMQAMYGTADSLAKKKASQLHDRVTIVVNRSANAKLEGTTDLSRESSLKTVLTSWFTPKLDKEGNLVANPRTGTQKPEIDVSAAREHKGEGETERKQTITNKISGEVIDVRPNGHLIVSARTQITVNGEREEVILTGRVAPEDLSPDSMVDANFIVDMQYRVLGKGEVAQNLRRGWGAKVLDIVNPF